MNRRNFLKALSTLLGVVAVRPIGEIIPLQGIIEGAAPTPITFIVDSRYFLQNGSEVLLAEGENRSAYVGYFHPGDFNDLHRNQS